MEALSALVGPPSPEQVDRIAGMPDPVLRNCFITEGYHKLAAAMAARAPGFNNWLMFAVWASKEAGRTIRGEDLTANLERYLKVPASWLAPVEALWRALLRRGLLSPETRLGRLVRAIPGPLDAIERASAAIADGNKLIFGEIARAFARYLSGEPVDQFLSIFTSGEPPAGQTCLRRAFEHYEQSYTEQGADRRAQLEYLANIEIAWHEQVRAQPLVKDAIDGPVLEIRELGERVLFVLAPPPLRVAALAVAAGLAVKPFAAFGMRIARAVVTEALMTMSVPGMTLSLGRDIDLPCPACLSQIDLPELRELLGKFDGDNPKCGADDWTSLDQRMRYIARFFRVFHPDMSLRAEPFTPGQIQQMRAGILPSGAL